MSSQPTTPGKRECGTCTACCTILGVVELKKPGYTRCVHLAEHGCGIYADRPHSCSQWNCCWLRGAEPGGDERHRPDNLGLMFDEEWIGVPGIPMLLLAWEVWEGASDTPQAKYLLSKIAKLRTVAVFRPTPAGTRCWLMFPRKDQESRTEAILARLKENRAALAAAHPAMRRDPK